MNIQKRFPADTQINKDQLTFLSDKKVNAELYAFFQSLSMPRDKETYVSKTDLPTQTEICKKIGVKSPKTYRTHLKYLIDQGYIIDNETEYYLPKKEDIYLLIPLETLQFLLDTLNE